MCQAKHKRTFEHIFSEFLNDLPSKLQQFNRLYFPVFYKIRHPMRYNRTKSDFAQNAVHYFVQNVSNMRDFNVVCQMNKKEDSWTTMSPPFHLSALKNPALTLCAIVFFKAFRTISVAAIASPVSYGATILILDARNFSASGEIRSVPRTSLSKL